MSTRLTAPERQQRTAGMSRAWGGLLWCKTHPPPWGHVQHRVLHLCSSQCRLQKDRQADAGDGCGQAGAAPRASCQHGLAEVSVGLAEQEVEERDETSSSDPLPPSSATELWGAPPAEELGDQYPHG